MEELLAMVGLAGLGEKYPHELSGGQQQRVALARALAPRPHLLLLDEPFSNLDVDLRERLSLEVRDILKQTGTAAMLVTHDQHEAFAVADVFSLLRRYLVEEIPELQKNSIRLSAIGRRDRLSTSVRQALDAAEEATRSGCRLHLRLALDYGARHEILEAARALARRVGSGELLPEEVDEDRFEAGLCGPGVPDPDLIIRTAGERRLSNFLLWAGRLRGTALLPGALAGLRRGGLRRRPGRLSLAHPEIRRGRQRDRYHRVSSSGLPPDGPAVDDERLARHVTRHGRGEE